MKSQKSLCLLIALFCSFFFSSSLGYNFYLSWVLNPTEKYNDWAGRNRFLVNDTLTFKYKQASDSVLEVNKDDYYNCNINDPIKILNSSTPIFKFDRSGPFYFIDGNKENCQKDQKLIVVVLVIWPKHKPQPPTPKTPAPVVSQPPKSSPSPSPPAHSPSPISPSPSPHVEPPSSISQSPSPNAKAPSPISQSPTPNSPVSPSPSALTPSQSPAPVAYTPSSSSPSPVAEGPAIPTTPSSAPTNSPIPATEAPPANTPQTSSGPASPPNSNQSANVNSPPPSTSVSLTLTPTSMVLLATSLFIGGVIN